jgi:hypothetical protein
VLPGLLPELAARHPCAHGVHLEAAARDCRLSSWRRGDPLLLFSPRPSAGDLGLWWWMRLATLLYFVNMAGMLALVVLRKLGF